MKLGSLFDGSGGFPLAGALCGIEPVWAAEIEPYPIAVTRSRFPGMKHLGNVSLINGAEIEPVDIVSFGSPCQDLSVAGLRRGLKHEGNGDDETTRSGLFMEAVRIIKEMREATSGRFPRFVIWENVPGAFSSTKGEDFRVVLQEIIRIIEPEAVMPAVPQGGWAYADCYCGDGWSLAYRVLDSQFIRTAQRRRRIYLIADFASERAKRILFDRESLRRFSGQGGTPWEATSAYTQGSTGADDRDGESTGGTGGRQPDAVTAYDIGNGQTNQIQPRDKIGALNCMHDQRAVVCRQGSFAAYVEGEFGTLKAAGGEFGAGSETLIIEKPRYIVRRLTPTECARLQGFPDRWGDIDHKDALTDEEYAFWLDVRNTHAAINGKQTKDYTPRQMLTWYNKLHTNSAEYKMWGNGCALPCALYAMEGIAEEAE